MEEEGDKDRRSEGKQRTEDMCNSADKLAEGSGESYLGAGAKDTHHGYTFQFHLLMLYATRALNLGRQDFKIATEMVHAEKFDDIIFSYPKEGKQSGRYFQFVQAKHSLNQRAKEIRPSQLFDQSGGPFSLTKYFDSYRKMKQNPHLLCSGDEVRSLVICSNMGFKYGQTVLHFPFDEAVFRRTGMDQMLSNELLKFREDFPGRKDVVLFLKDSCVSLPKEFASSLGKGKKFVLKSEADSTLCSSYKSALAREVVDLETRAFRKDFVESRGLSPAACHFRDELRFRFVDRATSLEQQDEDTFRTFLCKSVVDISGDLGVPPDTAQCSIKTLAKSLTELLANNLEARRARIDEKCPFLMGSVGVLLDLALVQKGGRLAFDQGFLKNKRLPEKMASFRESLRARLQQAGIKFEALEDFSFEWDNAQLASKAYSADRLEQDVLEFLDKLCFALNQPGIAELETRVKAEVAEYLNVADASNAYGRFFNAMYSWAESKDARYLTEEDVGRFFLERKKEMTGGIRFNARHPVVDFVGRVGQLREIHAVLQGTSEVGRSQIPRALVLSGLGGIGKSELAREYAKKHYPSQYDNVIWIDSENRERLESSFKMLAFGRLGILKEDKNGDVKDVEVIVQEIYDFFQDKKTLLVFDNVEVSGHLSKFFPRFFSGDDGVYVLMTARTRDWKGFPVIDVDNLSPEEALEFVQLSLGTLPTWDVEEARDLTRKVGNFPLALKQAVSYIEEMSRNRSSEGMSYRISKYVDLLGRSSENLLKCPFRKELLNIYSETTYRTMSIALDHMRKSKSGRMAIPMLNVITYLSPDSIAIDVLRNAYPRYTTCELDTSLDVLQKLSILKVDGSRGIIHRLIQSVNRINLKSSGKEVETIYEAMRMAEVMDVEHQMSAWECAAGHKILVKSFCRTPDMIAEQLSKRLMSTLALEFMEKAIKVISDCMGPDHYETLCSRRGLGRIYYFDGKYEDAARVQKQIWEDQGRVLGKDDPDTFQTMYHYGVSVSQLGRYKECVRIFQEIVDRGSSVVGEQHELIVCSKKQLLEHLQKLGRHGEKTEKLSKSIAHWAEGIVRMNQKEAKNCEDVRDSQSGLDGGQSAKVKEYLRLKEKKSGNVGQVNFNELLQAKIILAARCVEECRHNEACDHYRSCIELLRSEYSADHMKIKFMRLKLAGALISDGKSEEALDELTKDNVTIGNVLGQKYILGHALLTGQALWMKCEFENSVACFLQCFKEIKGEKEFTKTAPLFLLEVLKDCFTSGDANIPILILKMTYEALRDDLGIGPFVIEMLDLCHGFAQRLYRNDRWREGLELLKYRCQSYKLLLGEADFKTLQAKFQFGTYYCSFGRPSTVATGKQYMLEVHGTLCQQLREDVDVLNLMKNILYCLSQISGKDEFLNVLSVTRKHAVERLGGHHPLLLKLKIQKQIVERLGRHHPFLLKLKVMH